MWASDFQPKGHNSLPVLSLKPDTTTKAGTKAGNKCKKNHHTGLTPEQTRERDNVLIVKILAGDDNAFNDFWLLYRGLCYSTCRAFLHNPDDTEDAVQDIGMKIRKSLKDFDMTRDFAPWLNQISANHCKNKLKSISRLNRIRLIGETPQEANGDEEVSRYYREADGNPSPMERALQGEEASMVLIVLNELSEDHRQIMVMKHFEDLAYKDIAEALNIPIGTVMSRLFNARDRFKDTWMDKFGAPPSAFEDFEYQRPAVRKRNKCRNARAAKSTD